MPKYCISGLTVGPLHEGECVVVEGALNNTSEILGNVRPQRAPHLIVASDDASSSFSEWWRKGKRRLFVVLWTLQTELLIGDVAVEAKY